MAWWQVELDRDAHGQIRSALLPRPGMLEEGLRIPTGSLPRGGTGLEKSSSKAFHMSGVVDWTDGVHQDICCTHSPTATDKAGYATGTARRRIRPRPRAGGIPTPDSEMAKSIRKYFHENGYPPLTEEQRRAVVFFEGVRRRPR